MIGVLRIWNRCNYCSDGKMQNVSALTCDSHMQQRLLKDIKCIHDNVYKPFTNLSLQPTICLRLNSLWLGMSDLQQLEKCGMSITQISTCRPRWSKASSHLPITMPTPFRAISHHDTKLYANVQNHYTFVSINETFNSIICHLFTKQNNHTKNINFSALSIREARSVNSDFWRTAPWYCGNRVTSNF